MNRLFLYTFLACALAAWGMAVTGLKRATALGSMAPRLQLSHSAPSAPRSPFMGVRGHEGYWRIVQTRDGVWWFLSPQNNTEFLNGVTTVQPVLRSRDPRGPDFVAHDFAPRLGDAGLRTWAAATLRRVRQMGFKSLGAWSHPSLHQLDVPMAQDLNVCQWVPDRSRLFSADWRAAAEAAIRMQAAPLRSNRNLIGYYTDNELDWSDWAVGPRGFFDQLPPDDPNRREVMRVIRQSWPDVATFNREWNTSFHDWADLERHPVLPKSNSAGYNRLAHEWLFHLARAYFSMTADLIHKYDPNHLILGCRYRGTAPAEVVRAARGITDAQSLNYYAADALLDAESFTTISGESAQPLIISEYSFHALDGRSGDHNHAHFPAQVEDQEARAEGYRAMTARLARVPYVIGADWFQWMDEPPAGRLGDGEDANFGVVDVHDRGYDLLTDAVRETAPLLDNLHAGSAAPQTAAVWRPIPAPAGSLRPTQLAGGAADLNER